MSQVKSTAFVASDVFPADRFHAIDIGTVKTLTLLHDELWFDTMWLDEFRHVPPDQLAGGSVDSIVSTRWSLDDLESDVRQQAPKRFKDVRRIWKGLPPTVNTTMLQGWIRYEYGASGPEDFAVNIDYAASAALRRVAAQTDPSQWGRDAYHPVLHGAWVWAETGVGCATKDDVVFRSLHHLAVAAPDLVRDKPGLAEALAREKEVFAYADPATRPLLDLVEVAEVLVPDIAELSWDQILYLRSLPSFEHGQVLMRAGQSRRDLASVVRWADRQIDDLVLKLEPSMSKSLFNAFVGNIPIPLPVNPIGIAQSVTDIVSTARIRHDFGGVFWLVQARQLAHDEEDADQPPD